MPGHWFEALADHYDGDEYRFEVPVHEYDALAGTLRAHAYEPVVVEDLGAFCVVKEAYTPHAAILRDSVANAVDRSR